MMRDPLTSLSDTTERILQLERLLFRSPAQDISLDALPDLLFDPAMRLSDILDSLAQWPDAVYEGESEQSSGAYQGYYSPNLTASRRLRNIHTQPSRPSQSNRQTSHNAGHSITPTNVQFPGVSQLTISPNEPTPFKASAQASTYVARSRAADNPASISPLPNKVTQLNAPSLQTSQRSAQSDRPASVHAETQGYDVASVPSLSSSFRAMASLNLPVTAFDSQHVSSGIPDPQSLQSSTGSPSPVQANLAQVVEQYADELDLNNRTEGGAQVLNSSEPTRPSSGSTWQINEPLTTQQAPAFQSESMYDAPEAIGQSLNIPDRDASSDIPMTSGIRMARGASRLAAVLQGNVSDQEVSPTMRQHTEHQQAEQGSLAPVGRGRGIEAEEVRFHHQALERQVMEDAVVDELMDKLTERLEFELIRTYGTSSR